MHSESSIEFNMLNVGCGNAPRGDVNVDPSRSQMSLDKKSNNFVVANAAFLPFRDEAFDVAFSAFSVEGVKEPFPVLKEMCRVAKRKAIVRYFFTQGKGEEAPNHSHRFDETWLQNAASTLGFEIIQFTNSPDYPFSGRLLKKFPKRLQKIPTWGILRRFEKWYRKTRKVPIEMEAWIKKNDPDLTPPKRKFVVVYNIPEVFRDSFSSSPFVSPDKVIAYHNVDNESLSKFYNEAVRKHLAEDTWFIFCHQDFILREDLQSRLREKNTEAVYGPIGVRFAADHFLGQIIQANNQPLGDKLVKDATCPNA